MGKNQARPVVACARSVARRASPPAAARAHHPASPPSIPPIPQAHNAAKFARAGPGGEYDDGEAAPAPSRPVDTDVTYHTPAWHAARLAGLTKERVTWEEFKKQQKDAAALDAASDATTEKAQREFRAQLDADRAKAKMGRGVEEGGGGLGVGGWGGWHAAVPPVPAPADARTHHAPPCQALARGTNQAHLREELKASKKKSKKKSKDKERKKKKKKAAKEGRKRRRSSSPSSSSSSEGGGGKGGGGSRGGEAGGGVGEGAPVRLSDFMKGAV